MPINNPSNKSPATGAASTGKAAATDYVNGPFNRLVVINLSPASGGITSMTITPRGGSAYTVYGYGLAGGTWLIPPYATYNYSQGGGSVFLWSEQDS